MEAFAIRKDRWIVAGQVSYLVTWRESNFFLSCPICGLGGREDQECQGHLEEDRPFFVVVHAQTVQEAVDEALKAIFMEFCKWTNVKQPQRWQFDYYEDRLDCRTLNLSALLDWQLANHPKRVRLMGAK